MPTELLCCTLNQEQVDDGIEADGSNLSGVSGQCLWEDASCKTGADSSQQVAATCSDDDDDKENLRSHCRHGDRDQSRIPHDGQFRSQVLYTTTPVGQKTGHTTFAHNFGKC